MKAIELMEELFSLAIEREYSPLGDSCKCGNPDIEINKVAVTMFPTVNVIKEAKEWGADLLIVHEPLYFNYKEGEPDYIVKEKMKLVEESGLTIYRYHDHPHYTIPDVIAAGEFKYLGLKGEIETTDVFDLVRFHLDKPVTALELSEIIKEKLGVKYVRIAGTLNKPSTVISGMFGSPGNNVGIELKNEKSEIIIVGETSEWAYAEYARDADQLGYNKTLMVIGHVGSERDGMRYTADIIKEKHPELMVKYIECEEVYK